MEGNVDFSLVTGFFSGYEEYRIDTGNKIKFLIEAGNYDFVEDDLIRDGDFFPIDFYSQHRPPAGFCLIGFSEPTNPGEVVAFMLSLKDYIGRYRPANFRDLLVLGKEYPNLQKRRSILAIGQLSNELDGKTYFPVLMSTLKDDKKQRGLSVLEWKSGTGFGPSYVFLFVSDVF